MQKNNILHKAALVAALAGTALLAETALLATPMENIVARTIVVILVLSFFMVFSLF